MIIYIGSDHAGLDMKKSIIGFLKAANFEVEDMGPEVYVDNDDYPIYIDQVAKKIQENPTDRGIILGGSGQGEAISANRFKGIRAALFYGGNKEIVQLSREHNDSNILSLGARFLSEEDAHQAVSLWLNTKFSGDERHVRRIKEIDELS